MEKESNRQRTAVEMAQSIGNKPSENPWEATNKNDFDLEYELNNMGQEVGIEERDWQKLLSQAGVWMVELLDQKIENIQAKVVEQETAIELRKLFGVPLSLLAMPVFVELEKMELLARMDLKQEALDISQIWEQINNRILYMIQLFLASQIEEVAKEEKAHQEALKASQKEAEGLSLLSETVRGVEEKFEFKLEEIKKKKETLFDNFKKVSGNIQNLIEGSFENIFEAGKQSLQPIVIN